MSGTVLLVQPGSDPAGEVLTNLVENAIKYSPDGGRIELRLEAGDHRLRYSVTDEGIGIPMNEQARIFEKFYRLDPNLTRGVGGTGAEAQGRLAAVCRRFKSGT